MVLQATDIHFVPRKDYAAVFFRVGNDLVEKEKLSIPLYEKVISHFKFLGGMDIGEKRRPQSGSLTIPLENIILNLRLSTLPTMHQESLVIRLLPQSSVTSLHALTLFQHSAEKLLTLMRHSSGLIILTGPTGSGKTTTLYAMLQACKNTSNIITLEDPIEKPNEAALQVQINEKAGITYSVGLKAILRHDPDIIMVGEIRDQETAEAAIRAALTGHLVLTTLHTRNTIGAVYRLLEMGIPLHDLEQTLIGVVAQKLVTITCPVCRENCSPYCKKNRKDSRLAIFEMLDSSVLREVFKEVKGERTKYEYKRIYDVMLKGIALGYISEKELTALGEPIES